MQVSGATLSVGESGALAGWVVSLSLFIAVGAADVGWGVKAAGAGWRGCWGVSGVRVSGATLYAGVSGALADCGGAAGWVVSLSLSIAVGVADVGWGVNAAGDGWRGAVGVSGGAPSVGDVALGGASDVWGSGGATSAGDVAPGVVLGGVGAAGALAGGAGSAGWVVSFSVFILLAGRFVGYIVAYFGG